MESQTKTELFNVVIYEYATRKVESIDRSRW